MSCYIGRILLFLIFILISLGFVTSGQATEIIDLAHPDPYLWDRIQKEAAAREQSREIIGYYSLGKVSLEFRLVLESLSETTQTGFVQMLSPSGAKFIVAQKPLIDSNDIYGVSLEKTNYNGEEQYMVLIDFKPESWEKVQTITSGLINKNLSIVIDGTLFMAPTILEPINIGTTIHLRNPSVFENFKHGLILMQKNTPEVRHQRLTGWLESYVSKHPQNTKMKLLLIHKYMGSKPRKCAEALSLYENLPQTDTPEIYNVQTCYKALRQYDRALNSYSKLLLANTDKIRESELRIARAEMLGLQGEYQKMIDETEKAVAIMKAIPLTSFTGLPDGPDKERYIDAMRTRKDEAIRKYEISIEKMKFQLKQQRSY